MDNLAEQIAKALNEELDHQVARGNVFAAQRGLATVSIDGAGNSIGEVRLEVIDVVRIAARVIETRL